MSGRDWRGWAGAASRVLLDAGAGLGAVLRGVTRWRGFNRGWRETKARREAGECMCGLFLLPLPQCSSHAVLPSVVLLTALT